jgi:hypothetical protein
LWYASLGWSVVPVHKVVVATDGSTVCSCPAGASCGSKGKHPAVAWARYQRVAATPDQIRVWFEGPYASYGVGIVTGAVSGFVVVDVDEGPGKPGGETLNDLQFLNGDLPFTVMARTGGGGRHIFLLHPRDIWVTTGRNVLGPGVDVRGDGGFIVAAPSMHESGRIYLWDETAHPRVTPIAPAPPWLLEMAEALPPETGAGGAGGRALPTGTGEIVRDAWGKVIDGRERFMVGIVCGVIASMAREAGALPAPEAVVAEAWPTYERAARPRGASLDADGRGIALLRQRVGHFLRRARDGKWDLDKSRETREAPPFVDPGNEDASSFPATPIDDLDLDTIPPRQWVFGRELVRGFVSVLASIGGTGKTAYTMAEGVSVAIGRSLFHTGFGPPPIHLKVHQSGPVWFYNLEDPADELRRRVKATLQHHKVSRSEVAGKVFLDSGRDRPLCIAKRMADGRIALAPLIDPLVEELIRRGIVLLVIDPFVQSHDAEENRNEEMNLVMAAWGQVANRANCAVWLIHHFRKGGQGGDVDAIRGAGAIQGAARSMHTLSTMSLADAITMNIETTDRWRFVRHDNVKQNMAPSADKATWFQLASVDLANATPQYPEGDSVQAVEIWIPPSPWEGVTWEQIEKILTRIDRGPGEGEFYSLSRQAADRWAGTVIMEVCRDSYAQATAILKKWIEEGVLEEGQYTSPRRRHLATCVRVNQSKFQEMRPSRSAADDY